MERLTYPTPLIGFAEMVRQHGDNWQYHGWTLAERLQDAGRKMAFLKACGENNDEWREWWASLTTVKYNSRAIIRAKKVAS